MHHRTATLIVLTAAIGATRVGAQAPDSATLTLDRIFASAEFAPRRFGPAEWLDGGAAYVTLERSASGKGTDVVRYDSETGRREIIVPATQLVPSGDSLPLAIDDYAFSADGRRLLVFTNSRRVWRANTRGDYWVLDRSTSRLRKLGGDARPSTLMFAKFAPDGRRVSYVRENNLYVEHLDDGRIVQLTADGSRTRINGTFDWVYEEELGLRDGSRWSPDGRSIAYWQLDASGIRDFLLINNTDSLYPFITPVQYPKVGTINSAARVGVVRADGGATRWLDVPGDPRDNYIARLEWAPDSREVVLQHLNRLQNRNEVLAADVVSGKTRTVLVERDSAWVDVADDWQWLDGGDRFLWVSERDGWRHLFAAARDGKSAPRPLTEGAFDVIDLALVDTAGGWVYYTASPSNATQRFLYRSSLRRPGPPERVTPAASGGVHSYRASPNGRLAFHTYSSFDVPPNTELVRLPRHETVRVLADNTALREKVGALAGGPSEFFRVDIGGGVQLDAWMMKPSSFDPTRRYPVLFYVYGEPAGQTVLDVWSGARYLWHLMLTQQGYIVASVDNRGTPAPRGRAWRKAIYRQVGILASQEQAAAARAIARGRPYVDSTRFAVWGWSGGGSMSLNLIFRSPELYRAAMSVAPVTDQRYYDTIYQERYMGLPRDNPEGYRLGSPITFAHQLRGNLLVVHGTGDDNVHYQNTERLVNALVAANKPFTMMAYPNRSHGIFEGPNTTRHLYGLLTRYLREHLPAGPASPTSASR